MLAVMAQARFARSVHSFICELLMLTMPDLVKGNAFIRNDTDFCKRIDDAIRDATNPTAEGGNHATHPKLSLNTLIPDFCKGG